MSAWTSFIMILRTRPTSSVIMAMFIRVMRPIISSLSSSSKGFPYNQNYVIPFTKLITKQILEISIPFIHYSDQSDHWLLGPASSWFLEPDPSSLWSWQCLFEWWGPSSSSLSSSSKGFSLWKIQHFLELFFCINSLSTVPSFQETFFLRLRGRKRTSGCCCCSGWEEEDDDSEFSMVMVVVVVAVTEAATGLVVLKGLAMFEI